MRLWSISIGLMAMALGAGTADAACDRACLGRALDTYLSAMIAHMPARAGLAPGAVMTENGARVGTDAGLWSGATALGAIQRRYFDPVSGQAAYYGLVDEGGKPAVTIVRLRIRDRRVSEVEAIVGRSTERLYDPKGLAEAAPPAGTIAPADRTPRAEMISATNRYLDAMQAHTSVGAPHSDDCRRMENGHTAGDNCVAGFERLTQISAVAHRRAFLVDDQAGAVLATGMFQRPAGALMPSGQPWKRNLFINLVLIKQGKVSLVSGAMHYMEPGEPDSTGWPDDPAR